MEDDPSQFQWGNSAVIWNHKVGCPGRTLQALGNLLHDGLPDLLQRHPWLELGTQDEGRPFQLPLVTLLFDTRWSKRNKIKPVDGTLLHCRKYEHDKKRKTKFQHTYG
ncbi:hypothetical protein ACFX13_018934 [Malus domestica]